MAIVAVHRPQQQQQQREVKEDPLDKVLKGLQIASNVFGIKTSLEQSRLNDLKSQQAEQALKSGQLKLESQQQAAKLEEANILTPDQFSKQYFKVPDAKAFTATYGDIPLVSVQVGKNEITGVDRDTFKAFTSAKTLAERAPKPTKPVAPVRDPKVVQSEKVTNKTDEVFLKQFVKYRADGDAAKNAALIRQLDDAISFAETNLSSSFAGRSAGLLPDAARSLITPEDAAIEDDLKSVAQLSLKKILGGAFSEKEGTLLLNRAYNPLQEKSENIRRMKKLSTGLKAQYLATKASMDYFAKNNTIKGFKAPDLPPITTFVMSRERGPIGPVIIPGENTSDAGQKKESDADFIARKRREFGGQ